MQLVPTLLALAYAALIIPAQESKYSDKDFEASSTNGGYLPRLSFCTANSKNCKAGEFPVNHFSCVTGETDDDLGKEVDVVVIDWRPMALQTGDMVISTYDPSSADFERIKAQSEVKDSNCQYGPQFLIWIPQRKKFVTFFCGSKSSRKEAPGIKANMGKAITLKGKKCETPKYTWFTATCVPCAVPITDLPTQEELVEQVEKFRNPPKQNIETAAPSPSADR